MSTQETSTKLDAFTNSILEKAIDESRDIALELSEKAKAIVEQAEKEIAAETKRYKNAKIVEIKAAESRRINACMTENKRTLLQFREDCAIETFKEVCLKINEFTASEEYLPHLKLLLKKALDVLGYGVTAEVFLRREDMHFADELLASTSGVSLAFSQGSFTLGGLAISCPSKGRRVDMTFDASLNDMVGHFSELTGLNTGE
ncbi:MAG: V-type ATP synthase subunit E family protein [Oscillospiraceae bacterium]